MSESGLELQDFSFAEKGSAKTERRIVPLTESEGHFSDEKIDQLARQIITLIKKPDKKSRTAPGANLQNKILRALVNGDISNPQTFTGRVKELASQDVDGNFSGQAEDFLAGAAIAYEAAKNEQQFLERNNPGKETIIGTNNFLDARKQIDLVSIVLDPNNEDEIDEIRLIQVKGKGMTAAEADILRSAHQLFVEENIASPTEVENALKDQHIRRALETRWFWDPVLEEKDEGDLAIGLQEFFDGFLMDVFELEGELDSESLEVLAEEIELNPDFIKIFFETPKGKQTFDIFVDAYALDRKKAEKQFKKLRDWAADHEVTPETVEMLIPDGFKVDVRKIKKITSVIYDQVGTRKLDEVEIITSEDKGARMIDRS